MNPTQGMRPGFVSVEEAIALIKADKRENATVDLQFLANNIPYMEVGNNYNIRLLKTVPNPKTGRNETVRNGSVYVEIATEFDKQILLRAITDAFAARTSIRLDAENIGLCARSTLYDDSETSATVHPRISAPTLKPGEMMISKTEVVQQGGQDGTTN